MIPIVPYQDRHERLHAVFSRRAVFSAEIEETAREIVQRVRTEGDDALYEFTERFDGVRPPSIRVDSSAAERALNELPGLLRTILDEAIHNVRRFHERQMPESWLSDDGDDVVLGQRFMPIERVGLYVPGGKAAYPSSVIMNVVPAQVAGVGEIHLTSPPGPDGLPHPLVLAAARLLEVDHLYAVGGAQAVAALAAGTESIPRVDKIAGPGNAYVTAAKKLVFGDVAIDSVAGPSEIVVLADESADPEFAAADLLSQAEHDERASAVLVTTSDAVAESVCGCIEEMTRRLHRREIIESSLREFGACVIAGTMTEAIAAVNELAPEHLELLVRDPWDMMPLIRHAGAIFIGPYSPEPVGDYFAGPNHVLPTAGTARFASALGVEDFLRRQSVIAYSRERLMRTGPQIVSFAMAEQLDAHAHAVEVRLRRNPSS